MEEIVIDKGYFPTQETYIRNNLFILEKSASILLKNIKLLYYNSRRLVFTHLNHQIIGFINILIN